MRVIKDYGDYFDFDLLNYDSSDKSWELVITKYSKPVRGNGVFMTTDDNILENNSEDEYMYCRINSIKQRCIERDYKIRNIKIINN